MAIPVRVIYPGFDLDLQVLAGLGVNVPPHLVTPIRFARAVTGVSADSSAPDIDDHGFTTCPGGPMHGPSVGVVQGRTIRVKIMRDRIATDAPLVATMGDESIAQTEFPEAGDPLVPSDTPATGTDPPRPADCVFIRGLKAEQTTTLFVHHGRAGGPVLAQLSIRVLSELVVPVAGHLVRINGGQIHTQADVRETIPLASAVYAQAGIRFELVEPITQDDVTGFRDAGEVNLNTDELDRVRALSLNSNALNMYFIDRFNNTPRLGPMGIGNQVRFAPTSQTALVLAFVSVKSWRSYLLSHELGHVLGLDHYGLGQRDTHNVREDIWAHRSVMYNSDSLFPDPEDVNGNAAKAQARIEVGYPVIDGPMGIPGTHISNKLRAAQIPESDQIDRVRRSVLRKEFLPHTV
jgi:hypothetical protein